MTKRIKKVAIKHFQSLHDVDITLGKLTVIIGPSSSGKSALTRALHTITSNRRGTEWIELGEKSATVAVTLEDDTKVTLSRSRTSGASDNAYTIESPNNQPITFTKLGGEVPEQVSSILGITPKSAIQFAGQLDAPYLMDSSSAEVARVLGALTNVDVIFSASREANRTKLAQKTLQTTRQADLEAVTKRIPEFRVLNDQLRSLTEAERSIEATLQAQRVIDRARQALGVLTVASAELKRLESVINMPLTDIEPVVEQSRRLSVAKSLLSTVRSLSEALSVAERAVLSASEEERQASEALEAGVTEAKTSLRGRFEPHAKRWDAENGEFIEIDTATGVVVDWLG